MRIAFLINTIVFNIIYPQKWQVEPFSCAGNWYNLINNYSEHTCSIFQTTSLNYLDEYDIIWIYLGLVGQYLKIPEIVREQYPNKILWLQPDNYPDGDISKPLWNMDLVDKILLVRPLWSIPWYSKYKRKIFYMPFPYRNPHIEPLKLEERKKVAIMFHGVKNNSVKHMTNILEELNLDYIIFNKDNRLPWWEYVNELNKCYIGFDDSEYYGWSRFGWECAVLKIPVIGTRRTMTSIVAHPKLLTNHYDTKIQKKLIRKLFNNKKFYKENAELSYKLITKHLSRRKCLKRLENLIKESVYNESASLL